MKNNKEILVFSGNANRDLAKKICNYLKVQLGNAQVDRFNDGEIRIRIAEDVRGRDVFIVQPTCTPVNESLMELLIILDAVRRASARRITAILPYFGYARQDRKDQPRVPITAKLVANLLVSAGASRIITMDLHAPQIQGFFDIPVDHLFAAPVMVRYLQEKNLSNPVIVAPDVGGVKTARAFAKRLSAPLAIVDKRRDSPDKVEMVHVIGEVEGSSAILVDDLISTGGTLVEACHTLLKHGAKEVYASATHGIFSGEALRRIEDSELREVIVTDTIPRLETLPAKIMVLSVAELIGEAVKRIHLEESVSSLFF